MNITIAGPGALGILLANKLKSSNQIKLLVKKEHKDLIKNREILFKNLSGEVEATSIDIITELEESELLILCVKSYEAENLIDNLASTNISLMLCQNGLKTLHYSLQNIKKENIYYMVTGNGISKVKTGISEHKGDGFTYIGNLEGVSDTKLEILSENLNNAGIQASIVNNISDYIWLKTIINSAINPIAALAEVKNGKLRDSDLYEEVRNICLESKEIAIAAGVKLPLDPLNELNVILEKTADNKCSMVQDLENNRKTEIDAINGELVRIAKKFSVRSNFNQQVLTEIDKISVNS